MSVGTRQYGYSYTQSQASHNKILQHKTLKLGVVIFKFMFQDCMSHGSDSLSGHSHDGSGVVINVRCPSLSSARWCYRLYSIVLAGLGLLLSFLWVSSATSMHWSK